MHSRGVTLVELIITLSVAGILLLLSYSSYAGWMAPYRVESAARQLYVEIMQARIHALGTSRLHYLVLDTLHGKYTLYADRNDNAHPDPGEEMPGYPKETGYPLKWTGAGSKLTFEQNGTVTPNGKIYLLADVESDYDCMVVFRTRILSGKATKDPSGTITGCVYK